MNLSLPIGSSVFRLKTSFNLILIVSNNQSESQRFSSKLVCVLTFQDVLNDFKERLFLLGLRASWHRKKPIH